VKASFGLALDTQKLNDPSPSGPAHKVMLFKLLAREFLTYFASGWRQLCVRLVNGLGCQVESSYSLTPTLIVSIHTFL
jgi:hypothetical protein